MNSNFVSLEDFSLRSIQELEESFISKIYEYKANHSHILEICNITYDELCRSILSEFKTVLNCKEYNILYKEGAKKIDDSIEVFNEIYTDELIDEMIIRFYEQMYNHAYFRAALVIQKRLGETFKI